MSVPPSHPSEGGPSFDDAIRRARVAALLRRIVAMDDRGAAKLAREALAVLGVPPV